MARLKFTDALGKAVPPTWDRRQQFRTPRARRPSLSAAATDRQHLLHKLLRTLIQNTLPILLQNPYVFEADPEDGETSLKALHFKPHLILRSSLLSGNGNAVIATLVCLVPASLTKPLDPVVQYPVNNDLGTATQAGPASGAPISNLRVHSLTTVPFLQSLPLLTSPVIQ